MTLDDDIVEDVLYGRRLRSGSEVRGAVEELLCKHSSLGHRLMSRYRNAGSVWAQAVCRSSAPVRYHVAVHVPLPLLHSAGVTTDEIAEALPPAVGYSTVSVEVLSPLHRETEADIDARERKMIPDSDGTGGWAHGEEVYER